MEDQNSLFNAGRSKLNWPHSKHNSFPSLAVDVAPLVGSSINWGDLYLFYHFAGYVQSHADKMNIRIQGKGGASLFEIREKEVNPPIQKGEVKRNKEFVATYHKSIWLRLRKPNQVDVTVNGQPLKTKAYGVEKDYLITFLR